MLEGEAGHHGRTIGFAATTATAKQSNVPRHELRHIDHVADVVLPAALERPVGRHVHRLARAQRRLEILGQRPADAVGLGRGVSEVVGEAGLRWKDGSRDESKSQSAQGLRDDSHSARRLRGENARLLSILACREQELHELKNLGVLG